MIGTRTRYCWFAVISCCALLAACGDPPEQEAGKQAAVPGKSAKKAPSVVDNMVAAASAGKSAAAVGVYFSLRSPPTVSTALPVDIAVVPHREFTSLRAYFSAQDGLTLISGDQLPVMTSVGVEKPVEHELVVMPSRAGVYMITANLETEGEDGVVSRIFSIPVIVAPAVDAAGSSPPATMPAPAPK